MRDIMQRNAARRDDTREEISCEEMPYDGVSCEKVSCELLLREETSCKQVSCEKVQFEEVSLWM